MVRATAAIRACWSDEARARFRATLRQHHTGVECAAILRRDFGVKQASQASVSRWASGGIVHPTCAGQLIAYCDAYADEVDASNAHTEGVESPELDYVGLNTEREGDFARLASDVAGEPLLGPNQAELLRAMTDRLRSGPPLSPEDRLTYLDQLRVLRVPGARWR